MHAPPRIDPVHDIVFGESDDITAAFVLPGTDRVLVVLRTEAVDLWQLAVWHWPEVLGVLVAIVLLLGFWWLLRVLRRRQQRGEPYCRRCNYCLSGHSAQLVGANGPAKDAIRCPECGVDLAARPPRIGRSTRRRLAPAAAVVAMAVGGYLTLHAIGAGRACAAFGWLSLPSFQAQQLRQQHTLTWMDRFAHQADLLLEVDAASGRTIRRIGAHIGGTYFPIAMSPDGRLLALSGGGLDAVDLVSTATAGARATFEFPHDPYNGLHRTVEFAPDGESVYIAFSEQGRDRLVRWHWRTGVRDTIIDSAVFQRDMAGTMIPVIRKYALLNRSEGVRFLAAPDFSEAYPDVGSYLRIYDESGEELAHYAIQGGSPSATPVVTPDGRRAFVGARPGVIGFDLEAGIALGVLGGYRKPEGMLNGDDMATSSDGRLLAIPARDKIMLRDMKAQQWLAELHHDPDLIDPSPRFSHDGRWLLAIPFKDHAAPGAGRRFVRHLLIFDLSKLHAEGKTAPGGRQEPP